jgi:predicted nucleic acid-binding protein
MALDDFLELKVSRYPAKPFLNRAWALRKNLSPPDALFVALAEVLGAPLVTTDLRIARAPGLRAEILAFSG